MQDGAGRIRNGGAAISNLAGHAPAIAVAGAGLVALRVRGALRASLEGWIDAPTVLGIAIADVVARWRCVAGDGSSFAGARVRAAAHVAAGAVVTIVAPFGGALWLAAIGGRTRPADARRAQEITGAGDALARGVDAAAVAADPAQFAFMPRSTRRGQTFAIGTESVGSAIHTHTGGGRAPVALADRAIGALDIALAARREAERLDARFSLAADQPATIRRRHAVDSE
jgi:hypothetical protein